MRTRTWVLFSIFLLIKAVIFIFASCENGAVEYGYFMYDGTKYPVSKGFLEGSELVDGTFVNFDFLGATSGVGYQTGPTGTGNGMIMEFFSPTDPPAVGTYSIEVEDGPNWEDPYTFSGLYIFINVNFEAQTGDAWLLAESGTLTVTSASSNTISLEFDVILEDGKAATGMWSGPVEVSFDPWG